MKMGTPDGFRAEHLMYLLASAQAAGCTFSSDFLSVLTEHWVELRQIEREEARRFMLAQERQ